MPHTPIAREVIIGCLWFYSACSAFHDSSLHGSDNLENLLWLQKRALGFGRAFWMRECAWVLDRCISRNEGGKAAKKS